MQRMSLQKILGSTKIVLIWEGDALYNIVYYNHILNLFRMNQRVSQHALRGQLIAFYNSLRSLLDDFPVVRDKYFIIGLSQGKKEQELKENFAADPRFVSSLKMCFWGPGPSINAYYLANVNEYIFVWRMIA